MRDNPNVSNEVFFVGGLVKLAYLIDQFALLLRLLPEDHDVW